MTSPSRVADPVERFAAGDAGFRRDPWPLYSAARAATPVAWAPGLNAWVVLRHHDVRRALAQRALTADNPFRASRRAFGATVLDTEGDAHRRMRAPLARSLRSSVVAQHAAGRLAGLARAVVAGLPDRGRVDLVAAVARTVPMVAVCDLLGLGRDRAASLSSMVAPLAAYIDEAVTPLGAVRAARLAAEEAVAVALGPGVARVARHRGSGADVGAGAVGRGLAAAAATGALSDGEARRNAVLLLVAGTVTTSAALGNVLRALVVGAPAFDDVRAGRLAAADVVRETLRHDPPLHFTPRFAARDVTVGGATIPRGAAVQLGLASANRDEAAFPEPDAWRPERPVTPAPVTFGAGRHGCVGGTFGTHELEAVVTALVTRYGRVEPAEAPPRPEGWMLRSPARLVVEVDERA